MNADQLQEVVAQSIATSFWQMSGGEGRGRVDVGDLQLAYQVVTDLDLVRRLAIADRVDACTTSGYEVHFDDPSVKWGGVTDSAAGLLAWLRGDEP